MVSILPLVQYASQNIALFCCAMFAGAAVYVSLVEDPSISEGGTKLAEAYLVTWHPRPMIFQTAFGALGALAGMLAFIANGSPAWLLGAALLAAAALLHAAVVAPMARRCIEEGEEARPVFRRIVKLHGAVALGALAGLLTYILQAAGR